MPDQSGNSRALHQQFKHVGIRAESTYSWPHDKASRPWKATSAPLCYQTVAQNPWTETALRANLLGTPNVILGRGATPNGEVSWSSVRPSRVWSRSVLISTCAMLRTSGRP